MYFSLYVLLLLGVINSSMCVSEIDNVSDIESITTTTTASVDVTITTTANNNDDDDEGENLTTIKQTVDDEAQLPVDLLSDDVLLDPNVVLARLSRRDVNTMNRQKPMEYFNGHYNNWHKTRGANNRRQQLDYQREYEEEHQRNIKKKMKIYPIFPGK